MKEWGSRRGSPPPLPQEKGFGGKYFYPMKSFANRLSQEKS